MREALAAARPVIVELINYRKDGSKFWNQVCVKRNTLLCSMVHGQHMVNAAGLADPDEGPARQGGQLRGRPARHL